MNTCITYHGFAARHQSTLQTVTAQVLKACDPEKIFLLGLTDMRRRTETLFTDASATANYISHVYLLVLVNKPAEQALTAIQDKIENNLKHQVTATSIVLDMERFKLWIDEGNSFSLAVRQKGYLLWQKNGHPLPAAGICNSETIKQKREALIHNAGIRIEEFIAGAELFRMRMQYKLAAFMLHQAAEQALTTLMILNTGLKVVTHNIDKLLRYCSMFCYELPEPMFKNNEKDSRLMHVLQNAYIDSRYRDDFQVSNAEIGCLLAKICQLRSLFHKYNKLNTHHTILETLTGNSPLDDDEDKGEGI